MGISHGPARVVAWAALAAVTACIVAQASHHGWRNGDTVALVKGMPTISACLNHGVYWRCNHYAATHHLISSTATREVLFFPLIQQLPAWLMHVGGLTAGQVSSGLGWLNLVTVAAMSTVVLTWSHRKGGLRLAVLAGLLLLPGMLIPYSNQTFGEPLAAAAFAGVALSALRADRASVWLFPAAVVATVSKETAAPFVVVFGLSAIVLSGARRPTARRALAALMAGTGVGLLLAAAFNLFRYGALWNTPYIHMPHSPYGMLPIYFVGLFVSSNGGLAWFWPGVAISIGVLVFAALGRTPRGAVGAELRRSQIGAVLALVAVAGYALGCADWWDPFGWYAWGPRLLLPMAPLVIVLAISIIARQPGLGRWLSFPVGPLLAAAGIAVLLPTLGVTLQNGKGMMDQLYATWAYRPECMIPDKPISAVDSCNLLEQWRLTGDPLLNNGPRSSGSSPRYWMVIGTAGVGIALWTLLGALESRRIPRRNASPGSNRSSTGRPPRDVPRS